LHPSASVSTSAPAATTTAATSRATAGAAAVVAAPSHLYEWGSVSEGELLRESLSHSECEYRRDDEASLPEFVRCAAILAVTMKLVEHSNSGMLSVADS